MINDDKRKADKAEVDQELTDELKQTFPASDPPTITRQPLDRQHVESEKQEKKKKRD
ncbi:hypothetical protein [Methylocella sp. CPCC 101449]|jgi:hypothetical protein|uniref:hypothetical protein n=1 Tax=Methylocella sp. CPCC 101449 TaxID=2987531 RepID=UPI0028928855|nr:hypothetical protein [Methylocella sp. CPCC 101449]MDT2023010.1 hypothetical protein [Methylocella sp. CPCC 101449]HEV2570341.1 hypothetical protein [Beijerinckiaceae bacterium]